MIELFVQIMNGTNTLESLAKKQNKSSNRVSEIIQDLEKEGFVIKNKSFKMKGSRLSIGVANTNHAIKLKELVFKYPAINFQEIISDSKLLFLASLSEDWKDMKTVRDLTNISKHTIDRYRPLMKNRGILIKNKKLYKINENAWSLLKEFLIAYRKYSSLEGVIMWKYQNEVLFEVNKENQIKGSITGFAKYNIKINLVSVLCKLPKKKLSKEEIFIHSLFEVQDPRTLYLALVFYKKNKLNDKKVLPIAMRYDKYTMFNDLVSCLKLKEKSFKLEKIPKFEKSEFRRIAKMYGVKNV